MRSLTVLGCFALAFLAHLGFEDQCFAQDGQNTPRQPVSWEAPKDCVPEEELRAEVLRQWQKESNAGSREVRATAERTADGFTFDLAVYEEGRFLGNRVLRVEGSDCRSHDEALALVIALLLEHGPLPAESEEKTEAETPSTTESAETPLSNSEKEVNAQSSPGPALRTALELALYAGWTPEMAIGPRFAMGLSLFQRESWTFWLDGVGEYYSRRSVDVAEGAASLGTLGGRAHLQGCGLWERGRLGLETCLGSGAAFLRGEGTVEGKRIAELFVTAEAGVDLNARLLVFANVHILLGGNIFVPFGRADFVLLTPVGELQVHETSHIVGGGRVGLGLTF